MIFVYADPPYIGQAQKHYSHDPRCAEVDHEALITRLCEPWVDGWALSLSAPSIFEIGGIVRDLQKRGIAPLDIRCAAWVKPFASFKPNVNPGYCWEPVIFRGGRRYTRKAATIRDFVSESITLRRGLAGAKPDGFCWWLFDLWHAEAADTFVDVFPGSGAVGRAWDRYMADRASGGPLLSRVSA